MADSKITDLAALAAASLSSTDQFVAVDVSDSSMAASGTDVKIGAGALGVGISPFQDYYGAAQGIDTVTSTNYTLVLADVGRLKQLNAAAVGVVRLPLNASVAIPVGTHIDMAQVNVGQYTVTTQAGVTLISNPATPKTTTSALASVIKTATDTWIAGGYLV